MAIKVTGASLTYLMFALIAKASSTTEYGIFSTGFALATICAQISLFGQAQLALREIPRIESKQNSVLETALSSLCYVRCLVGWAATSLILGVACIKLDYLPYFPIVVLTLCLALADLQLQLLRGRGHILRAFLPREVIWRSSIVGVSLLVIQGIFPELSAEYFLLIVGVILLTLLVIQSSTDSGVSIWKVSIRRMLPLNTHLKDSIEYWINALITTAIPNISTIIVGIFLSLEDAALFFAATKTSQALQFLPIAMELAGAPQLSRAFATKNHEEAQRLCRLTSLFSAASAVSVFAVLAYCGPYLLSLFGPKYEFAYSLLLVLGFGYFAQALFGPSRPVLNMSNNQKALNKICFSTNIIAVFLLPIFALYFGTVGVAITYSLAIVFTAALSRSWVKRNLRIETSIMSLLAHKSNAENRN